MSYGGVASYERGTPVGGSENLSGELLVKLIVKEQESPGEADLVQYASQPEITECSISYSPGISRLIEG